jgi:hypothetical protein
VTEGVKADAGQSGALGGDVEDDGREASIAFDDFLVGLG